ncbi:MAG: EamA family transporter [Blastocatellia bacterium]
MWLFFALLCPFFYAVVCVLDSYCVGKVFDRPWIGVITSSLASIPAFLLLPLAIPIWVRPGWSIVALAFLAGALIQAMQALYFQSLAYSEAGVVAAYLNFTPVLVIVASHWFFGQAFGVWAYVGVVVNIAASALMCLMDGNFQTRWRAFFLMLAGCSFYSAGLLIEKHIFDRVPVLEGFLLITVGIVGSGLAPLFLARARRAFYNNLAALKPVIPAVAGIEAINLLAIYSRHRAVSLSHPSLIEAIATTQTAYTFLLSLALCSLAPRLGDPQAGRQLWAKLLLVGAMVLGVRLVSSD